jgi:DNA-binding winged helix-turn-helix (wHTH) protein
MRGNDAGVPPSAPPGETAVAPASPGPNSPTSLFQFELYELNPQSYELRRKGLRLRVPRSPMELLVLLIERRDAVVSRKEIAERLWSEPNMVDVDQGINTAIRRIREVLRDDPSKPRFIETVVGKGYRFIAEVKEVRADLTLPTVPASQSTPPEQDTSGTKFNSAESSGTGDRREATLPQPRRWRKRWIFATVVVALSLILWGGYAKWRSHTEKVSDYRSSLVQITTNDSEQRVTAAAISPDGRWIAYGDINGISLRLLQSRRTIELNAPEKFVRSALHGFLTKRKF